MSGLFGYLDPHGELPDDCADQMAQWMACPADKTTTIIRGHRFALGCVSKGVYAGEGDVLLSSRSKRWCLFVGRIVGFQGEEETPDPVSAARRAFIEDASPLSLATANGSFAAAVWDEGCRHLELILDRHGTYPLYVARHGSALLFAGRMAALIGSGVIPAELNPSAVGLMVCIGELVGNITPVKRVRLLPAASKSVFTVDGEETSRYWQRGFSRDATGFEATARHLGDLLRQAVVRSCWSAQRIGVPLSGGLDSRVLLAATPNPLSVKTFTWGIRGCRDLRYGTQAALAFGCPHQAFEYDGAYLSGLGALGVWITEGQLPVTDFHVLPYVDKVAESCDVILNGMAGDAALGGDFIKRPWWKARSRAEAADALWRWRDINLPSSYRANLFGPVMQGCDVGDVRAAFVQEYVDAPGRNVMDMAMSFLLDNRTRRRISCGTELMRWGVESQQPFLDNDFFDLVSRVPYEWLYRRRLYLQMIRDYFPKAAKIPWQRTGIAAGAPWWLMYLSLAVHRLDRLKWFQQFFRKRRVSDFSSWMRGPLRGYVADVLTATRTLDRGLFEADMIRRAVRDHMEGANDNSALLGSMISMELFSRLFVDREQDLIDRCRTIAPRARVVAAGTGP